MNPHLSALQISECFIGGAAPCVEQHARECAECQAELAFLGDSLSRFRGAVGRWSNHVDGAEYQVVFRGTPARHVCGSWRLAGVSSLAAHAMLLAAVFVLGTLHPVQNLVKQHFTELVVDLRPYLAENKRLSGGGGGGGARQLLEASKGKLPKPEPRHFTPPRVDPVEAKLQMPPSIVAPADMPNLQANNFGDPLSKLGIPSNGSGFGGGIGSGAEGGVGPGHGAGPGSGAGFGGGAYSIGDGVSAPRVLFQSGARIFRRSAQSQVAGYGGALRYRRRDGPAESCERAAVAGTRSGSKSDGCGLAMEIQAGTERRQSGAGDRHHRSQLPALVAASAGL